MVADTVDVMVAVTVAVMGAEVMGKVAVVVATRVVTKEEEAKA